MRYALHLNVQPTALFTASAMFLILLWKTVALTYAVFYSLTVTVAQVSTAICEPSFQWMFNSLGQSPYLVAAYVQGACEPNGQWTTPSLPGPTYAYGGPALFQANPCTCSSVAYSLSSACGDCQGADWPLFSEWTINCSSSDISYSVFPHAIPLGTAIPAWAYGQITTRFDPNQAQLIMESGAPESTALGAPPAATGTSQAPNTVTGGDTFSPTNSATGFASTNTGGAQITDSPTGKSTKSSNLGAIIGGAVGGGLGVILIGVLVFFLFRRQRRKTTPASAQFTAVADISPAFPNPDLDEKVTPGQYTPTSATAFLSSGIPPPTSADSAMKLYDPSDPSTYPSSPVSSGYDNSSYVVQTSGPLGGAKTHQAVPGRHIPEI